MGTGWSTCSFAVRDANKLFEMQSFRILGRKTCMSAHHFHRSAGCFCISGRKPDCRAFTILLFYYLLFHCHWVPSRRFLHLGPQNLNVGRTVYHCIILLFHFHWFPARRFLASRAAKPECRPTIFTVWPGVFASRAADGRAGLLHRSSYHLYMAVAINWGSLLRDGPCKEDHRTWRFVFGAPDFGKLTDASRFTPRLPLGSRTLKALNMRHRTQAENCIALSQLWASKSTKDHVPEGPCA